MRRKSDDLVYALKKVSLRGLPASEKEGALNEVRILASVEDNSVIGYKEAFYDEASQSLCIVMEFADGGDLEGLIKKHKKAGTYFEEAQIWSYFIQMLNGIKALHSTGIVHRDIKCANIFLTKEG